MIVDKAMFSASNKLYLVTSKLSIKSIDFQKQIESYWSNNVDIGYTYGHYVMYKG